MRGIRIAAVLMSALLAVAGCMISGTIYDADGEAISGVIVTLEGDSVKTFITDTEGRYSFFSPELKNAKSKVVPEKPGLRFIPEQMIVENAISGSDYNFTGINSFVIIEAWPMHSIDSRFRGANALMPGDVNMDGYTDYVTNYEFSQRVVIEFHPGALADVKKPWPTVSVKYPKPPYLNDAINPEHTALGDFDGDGNVDVAVAQGFSEISWWEGSQPGIRLIWGPDKDMVLDSCAWEDSGRIPLSIDRGHLIYVNPADIDGDGLVDIVSGGRVHAGNGRKGGIIWIKAPDLPEERRDLSKWSIYDIDPEQFDAHGIVFNDVDMDGDMDIVLANADFDTPPEEEELVWYENPGTGTPEQKLPWHKHTIYKGDEFHTKPQVIPVDLDNDGLTDLIVQLEKHIYFFRKTGIAPVSWELVKIRKDPVAQFLSRTLRIGDINNDGKTDIIGMLVHKESTLPYCKAAVFWMEYTGETPAADNWITHVVKWGSGRTMIVPEFGEKWDQADITDIDGDGDLDIVANCEEWWEDGWGIAPFWSEKVSPACVAVSWFENRTGELPYSHIEIDGVCEIDAEHYNTLSDGSWVQRNVYSGYSGQGYLQDFNAINPSLRRWSATVGASYTVSLSGGSYFLWMKRYTPLDWGWTLALLGKGRSDSSWLGIDGVPFKESPKEISPIYNEWVWVKVAEGVMLSPGIHFLELRVKEGGCAVDGLFIQKDGAAMPQ